MRCGSVLDLKKVGRNIKSLREESGLNQKQVAEFLNLDQRIVAEIENGERNISADLLDKLSDLFCCPVSTFVLSNEGLVSGIKYKSDLIRKEDLDSLALINKIVLNQLEMDKTARRSKDKR